MATGARLAAAAAAVLCAWGLAACGSGDSSSPPSKTRSSTHETHATITTSTASHVTTGAAALPGTGHPPVTIGDKNFTEQFVLGELYALALQAQGYNVSLNRNIGPTEVSYQAVASGRLAMYPEYINVWNSSVAGYTSLPAGSEWAFQAGQNYAQAHGLELLSPTRFSDTQAIAVTRSYARANGLHTIEDLRRVATGMTLGAPQEFQQSPTALPQLEQVYGFTPAAVKSLDIGAQYAALDKGIVQAAYVTTTDGQLASHAYRLLRDPQAVFGIGNVVPVVSEKVLVDEGPAFAATINSVSSLLSLRVIRQLDAAVDLAGEDPAAVAKQFLQEHGLVPASAS
jgi:osmoprotectant transport system substrate-binding protein